MKTFKILFAAIIIAGFANTAMAQDSSADATASAEARVIADLDITKDTDISWGDVAQSSSPNINPTNGTFDAAGLNGSGISVGKFTIDGTQGASIIITWGHNNLTGPGDAIIWTPELSYLASDGNNEGVAHGGEEIESGDDKILGDEGIGMVFVGGEITIASEQMPGTYNGDITVTVEYN